MKLIVSYKMLDANNKYVFDAAADWKVKDILRLRHAYEKMYCHSDHIAFPLRFFAIDVLGGMQEIQLD